MPSAFATVGSDKAITNATYTIGWNWYFDKSSTAVTVDPAVNPSDTDTGDTYMGNGGTYDAAPSTTTPANLDDLKLEITITATQID